MWLIVLVYFNSLVLRWFAGGGVLRLIGLFDWFMVMVITGFWFVELITCTFYL